MEQAHRTSLERGTAFVTGAGGQLAMAVVSALLDAGWQVTGTVRPGKLRATTKRFELQHGRAFATGQLRLAETDLLVPAAVAETIAVQERHQGHPDALIHLSGGFELGPKAGEPADAALALFDRLLSANVRTAVCSAGAVLPGMLARNAGTLIAIGAAAAHQPGAGAGAYAAAKASLDAYWTALTLQTAGTGVSVGLIVPQGAFDTPSNRESMPRANYDNWISPEAFAQTVLFMLDRPLRGQLLRLVLRANG